VELQDFIKTTVPLAVVEELYKEVVTRLLVKTVMDLGLRLSIVYGISFNTFGPSYLALVVEEWKENLGLQGRLWLGDIMWGWLNG
jgi:hypothetical protein